MDKKRQNSRIEELGKDLLTTNFFTEGGSCAPKPKKSYSLLLGFLLVLILTLSAGIVSMWAASDATIPLSVEIPVSPPPAPTINFSSDKTDALPGDSAILTWSTSNAVSCAASTTFDALDWTGAVGLNDKKTVTLPSTDGIYNYTLNCANTSGTSSKAVAINVKAALCGNGVCETSRNENGFTCPMDCEAVSPQPISEKLENIFQEIKEISIGGPSVSPSVIKLSAKPGEKVKSSFTYINNGNSSKTISLVLRPFIPSDGETGSPVFIDKDNKAITSPLKDWIKLDKEEYTIDSGKSAIIGFAINVPNNAEIKKYYVAVIASDKNDEEGNGSAISTEMGVLVVLDVQKPILAIKYPWYFYAAIIALILIVIAWLILFKKAREEHKERKLKKKRKHV
ncbi:MAG: hypothetical protein PHU42_04235 [Patescibacteria group bacterium]|nr:hypothetical protein [Patescibacteria group bacterium]